MNTRDAFGQLCRAAARCRVCPDLADRRAVLSASNGPLEARLMFIAEAPGRFGADRTGRPLTGDASARNFDRLLREAGIDRSACFITNAVLCNPRDGAGRNRRPNTREVANCSAHLRAQIELVNPAIVAALGAVALAALARIEPHGLRLSRNVGVGFPWFRRLLAPLYHPSPRAMARRRFEKQLADYLIVNNLLLQRCSGGDS